MGIFDVFKKDKGPDYDPSDLKITDLRCGFIVEYDLKTWEVKEEYKYDWGNNYFTREFKLESADEVIFLSMDENDELDLSVCKKIKIRSVGDDIPEHIIKHQEAPKKIHYNGEDFFLDKESPGYFSDDPENDDSWTELISWDYYNKSEEDILCIEQWGDKEFEASFGKVVKSFEFSDIIPGE